MIYIFPQILKLKLQMSFITLKSDRNTYWPFDYNETEV